MPTFLPYYVQLLNHYLFIASQCTNGFKIVLLIISMGQKLCSLHATEASVYTALFIDLDGAWEFIDLTINSAFPEVPLDVIKILARYTAIKTYVGVAPKAHTLSRVYTRGRCSFRFRCPPGAIIALEVFFYLKNRFLMKFHVDRMGHDQVYG